MNAELDIFLEFSESVTHFFFENSSRYSAGSSEECVRGAGSGQKPGMLLLLTMRRSDLHHIELSGPK